MLEALLVALALVCLGLVCVSIWLVRQLRDFIKLQGERDAVRDRRLKELSRRLDAYLTGSVQMGAEVHELRRAVAPLPDKIHQIERRDPCSRSFTQAARLAGMGASVDDLTQSCGLSKAEAELVSKMQQAKLLRS